MAKHLGAKSCGLQASVQSAWSSEGPAQTVDHSSSTRTLETWAVAGEEKAWGGGAQGRGPWCLTQEVRTGLQVCGNGGSKGALTPQEQEEPLFLTEGGRGSHHNPEVLRKQIRLCSSPLTA